MNATTPGVDNDVFLFQVRPKPETRSSALSAASSGEILSHPDRSQVLNMLFEII